MPTKSFDKESIKASIIGKLQRYNGRTISEASNAQIYRALASTVRDQIMQKWMLFVALTLEICSICLRAIAPKNR